MKWSALPENKYFIATSFCDDTHYVSPFFCFAISCGYHMVTFFEYLYHRYPYYNSSLCSFMINLSQKKGGWWGSGKNWAVEEIGEINKPLYFHWKLYKLFHIYANEHEGIMCVIFFSDYCECCSNLYIYNRNGWKHCIIKLFQVMEKEPSSTINSQVTKSRDSIGMNNVFYYDV